MKQLHYIAYSIEKYPRLYMKEIKVVSDPLNHLILNRMFHLHLNTMRRLKNVVSVDLYKNMTTYDISPDYLERDLQSVSSSLAKAISGDKLLKLNLFDKDSYLFKMKSGILQWSNDKLRVIMALSMS